jgi:hypothetical protein
LESGYRICLSAQSKTIFEILKPSNLFARQFNRANIGFPRGYKNNGRLAFSYINPASSSIDKDAFTWKTSINFNAYIWQLSTEVLKL